MSSPSTEMPPKLTINSTVRLASGYDMPRLGLGVYQIPAASCHSVIATALSAGYRHIDSATSYRNERPCIVPLTAAHTRTSIFFTTKLPPKLRGYSDTRASIASVLSENPELQGYIDLYLIHAPYGSAADRRGQWRAMAEAQRAGAIRSLGVSNYGVQHLEELRAVMAEEGGVLSVGQWELHPWCERPDVVGWCAREGVHVQAYAPLVRGTRMREPALVRLAEKYGRTPAQVLVRWSLQRGWTPLPKSVQPERIVENADVFGWELTEEEVETLGTGGYEPVCWDPAKEPL